METPTPSPSPESLSPSSTGASWRSRWAQRLSWLISALSGTLEIEAEHRQRMRELDQDNERLDRIILQTRNETERLKSETKQIEKDYEQRQKEYEQRQKEYERRMKDYEQQMREFEQDNERLDRIILQTKNETKQIEKENERLAALESKIDSLFCKYGINLPLARRPKQP